MTRATGNDLRRAILDEARRVLTEQGYTSLSTRRIAAAVGCTATSIYLYYKNKDALIHALIDEGMDVLHGRLEAARGTETNGANPVEQLARMARAYVDFGLEQSEYYQVMFMLHPEHMERYPADSYRKARRNLEVFAAIAGGAQDEALRRATLIWSSLHGLVSLLIAQRVDASLDRAALIDEAIAQACRVVRA